MKPTYIFSVFCFSMLAVIMLLGDFQEKHTCCCHVFPGSEQENMLMQEWPSCFFWKRVEKHDSARVVVMFFSGSEWKNMIAQELLSCFSWK